MTGKKILLPEPTLRRLPWYLSYVEMLNSQGQSFVSSTQISHALSVDSSQIAKDLSFLNLKGKTGIGYNVKDLVDTLNSFLSFKRRHNAVIVGVGSLGTALIHDSGLSNYGLHIVAGFDRDFERVGEYICGVPVFHTDEMRYRRAQFEASIGILTVPADQAQTSADYMVASGIKAIWNFTPYRIKVREGIVISNISIYAHLALIYNRLEAAPTKEEKKK